MCIRDSLTLRAVDGVPEAMEHPSLPILGVQFHPERMSGPLLRPDTVDGAPIFRWLDVYKRQGPAPDGGTDGLR